MFFFSLYSQIPLVSERLSPEGGESRTNSDSSLQKWTNDLKSPLNPFKTSNESTRSKRHNGSSRRKESKHYQESDILESPSVYEYCRSNLGDKISDYEDLWTQENNSRSSLHIALDNTSGGTNSSKECEVSSPMVISPPQQQQQLTPIQFAGSEVAIVTTPMQAKTAFDTKKSPFYSDPVDAVVQSSTILPSAAIVQRREAKLNLLPSFHRYSEPPKGQFEDFINFHTASLLPNSTERNTQQQAFIAASLDHLKSINKPIDRGNGNHHQIDPVWTVDSSWEFVDKNEDSSENNSVRNSKQILALPNSSLRFQNSSNFKQQKFNTVERSKCAMSIDSYLMNSKKSNIYKMVAKKYPEIHLRNVATATAINQLSTIPASWQTFDSDCSNKFQRLSSYDNVEQLSVYGESEDGTLFSEPWDSSQWDTFLPTTDGKTCNYYF